MMKVIRKALFDMQWKVRLGLSDLRATAKAAAILVFALGLLNILQFALIQPVVAQDTTPPTIISTQPEDGDTDVPLEVLALMNFSEPMDEDSVMNSRFTLTDLTDSAIFESNLIELVDSGLVSAEFNGDSTTLP
jgi:hypothetical protein